LWIW